MSEIVIDLVNCHGIPKLRCNLRLGGRLETAAIYAPNGTMKSSLARTFEDIAEGRESRDAYFEDRISARSISFLEGVAGASWDVTVVHPLDERFAMDEVAASALVDPGLRDEYQELLAEVGAPVGALVSSLKKRLKVRRDISEQLPEWLGARGRAIPEALYALRGQVHPEGAGQWTDLEYGTVFDPAVLTFLAQRANMELLGKFAGRYAELLADSRVLGPGGFDLHGAADVAKNLSANGYFARGHAVALGGAGGDIVSSAQELQGIIEEERRRIASDPALIAEFEQLERAMYTKVELRRFLEYIRKHLDLLARMRNPEDLRRDVLVSYLCDDHDTFIEFVEVFQRSRERLKSIEVQARQLPDAWADHISQFNSRFIVPFELELVNCASLVLGAEGAVPALAFKFKDERGTVPVERDVLNKRLSQGERRALYLLQVLFQVEAASQAGGDQLIVVDDIADSFDYRNKHAIVEYLLDVAGRKGVRLLVLTHNFDFLRTMVSRGLVAADNCFIARRIATDEPVIEVVEAGGEFDNPFAKRWRSRVFTGSAERIASVPFARNLIEYTKGKNEQDYKRLTAGLHVKLDNPLTQSELDGIYLRLFDLPGAWPDPSGLVTDATVDVAIQIVDCGMALDLANKVVVAMACRVLSETFVVRKLGLTNSDLAQIKAFQTSKLISRYKASPKCDATIAKLLDEAQLLAPESIHLNSFMYEPLVDLSAERLVSVFSRLRLL